MLFKKIEVQRFFFTILIVTVSAIATAQERQEIHGSVPLQMDAREMEYLRENARQRLNGFLGDELELAMRRLTEALPSANARRIRDRLEQHAQRLIMRLTEEHNQQRAEPYWNVEPLIEMELQRLIDREIEAEIRRQETFAYPLTTELKNPMPGQTTAVNEQDSLALVACYYSTNGDNWTNNTNWLKGQVETWYGVTISGGRVTRITLYNNQLSGNIPPDIGNLTNLFSLNLANNQLSGSIPPEIGNLTNLSSFNLHSNRLSGSIPAEIDNLTNLSYLDLHDNQLSGIIPQEFGNLTNLKRLFLSANQFSGIIPAEISNLTNLLSLNLSYNQFSGIIPAEISNLMNLIHVDFAVNQLSGNIPPEIGKLMKLEDLSIHQNQLSGGIPTEMGDLKNLKFLHMSWNQLGGNIPPQIGNLEKLEAFLLASNNFTDLPTLKHLSGTLSCLFTNYNRLTFEDIEPNIGITGFVYAPQDSIETDGPDWVFAGQSLNLSVTVGGTANQYQWYKDGSKIANALGTSYTVAAFYAADAGVYHCQVTNTIATELTIYSRKKRVEVEAEPSLTVDPTSLTLKSAADSRESFNVSSNVNWSVSKDADWLAVSPDSATGNATVTATGTSANTSGDSRRATVTVSGSGIARTVAVTQLGAEPYLTVDPTSLILGSAANSQGSFSITSNVSWSLSKDADWLAVFPDSATGNATVTATATSANTSADSRRATVTVSGSGITRAVAVTQLGSPTIPDDTAQLKIHPNPFTPNGDGFNDLLRFDFRGMGYSSPEVVIFNMKGAEIRRLTNPGDCEIVWDGRDREGRLQPPGVYIYMLSEGGSVVTKGTVVLAL